MHFANTDSDQFMFSSLNRRKNIKIGILVLFVSLVKAIQRYL